MSIFDKGYLWFAMLIFTFFVVSAGMLVSADKSTDGALKQATEQSMYIGVNKGCLRVDENVTLNEKVTKENFKEKYASLVTYHDGYTNLYVHDFNSYPAMLSTEAYQTIKTPIKGWYNSLRNENLSDEDTVRSLEVGIFEATSITKPKTAESLEDVGKEKEVDNFQCN